MPTVRGGCASCIEEVVWLPEREVVEEDLVQLIVVVLTRVDDHVLDVAVEGGHDARQADDLRTGSDDGQDFHGHAG